jgi:hypothetical protein
MAKSMSSASGIGGGGSLPLDNQVQVALAKKAQDLARQQGQAAISLLASAVQLQEQALPGGSGGLGQRLDVRG